MTQVKIGKIYKNADGEYFKAVEHNGDIVLSNPSYPFFFLPEVQQPLEEIGDSEQFEQLIVKENHTFIEGDSITVEVDQKGDLKIKNSEGSK